MIFAGSLHVEHHPHALHGELGQPGDIPQLQEGPPGAGTASGPIAKQADVLHQVLLGCLFQIVLYILLHPEGPICMKIILLFTTVNCRLNTRLKIL